MSDIENTQFIPADDDEEQLWDVEKILNEKSGRYLIKWKGTDGNGKPWEDSWVPKHDVTDDLIKDWKRRKREKEEKQAISKAKKKKKTCASIDKSHFVFLSNMPNSWVVLLLTI